MTKKPKTHLTIKEAKLIKAFDEATSLYEEDHHVIFGSDSNRLKTYFSSELSEMRRWESPRTCVVKDCTNPSIPRSHSIQKSGPLSFIAENGHVMEPYFKEGSIQMRLVGVQNASVFPGFCRVHENLFSHFEQAKNLKSSSDIAMQCFRTVCRELVRFRHNIEHLKKVLDEFIQIRDNYILSKMRTFQPNINIKEIKFEGDPWEKLFNERIRAGREMVDIIESGIYKELIDEIQVGNSSVSIFYIQVPDIFPVCLSGLGTFQTNLEGHLKKAVLFLGVLPREIGTQIIVATNGDNRTLLEHYVKNHLDSRLGMLSAVEAWMIYQTDHWFIRPSVWNNLPKEKRDSLLMLLYTDHSTLGVECPFSIFDELRSTMISQLLDSDEYAKFPEMSNATIKKERDKIALLTVSSIPVDNSEILRRALGIPLHKPNR